MANLIGEARVGEEVAEDGPLVDQELCHLGEKGGGSPLHGIRINDHFDDFNLELLLSANKSLTYTLSEGNGELRECHS